MLNPKVKEIFKTTGKHHFFGYYDKCPWSKDGRYLLAMETDLVDRLPNEKDAASIGIIDLEGDKHFEKLTETRAWNFQQGCMLQWLGPDFNERIIFNDFRNGKFVSVIFNIKIEREEKEIPFPIYAVHPSGKFALSVNFSRLDWLREGYGYKGVKTDLKNESVLKDDGIFSIDLENENRGPKLIISLEKLRHNDYSSQIDKTFKHWVDHLTFNFKGERFLFLHRVEVPRIGMYSRLYSADKDGSGLYLFKSVRRMGSHFSWKNDKEFVIWARPPGLKASVNKSWLLTKIIRPIYRLLPKDIRYQGDWFLLFQDRSENFEKLGIGVLKEDGHETFSPNKKWFLTDTFNQKKHNRGLILYNLETKNNFEVNSFYTLPKVIKDKNWDSSGLRSDLHPRWNREGTQICIDSVHEGTRQMYVFDVVDIINEN